MSVAVSALSDGREMLLDAGKCYCCREEWLVEDKRTGG